MYNRPSYNEGQPKSLKIDCLRVSTTGAYYALGQRRQRCVHIASSFDETIGLFWEAGPIGWSFIMAVGVSQRGVQYKSIGTWAVRHLLTDERSGWLLRIPRDWIHLTVKGQCWRRVEDHRRFYEERTVLTSEEEVKGIASITGLFAAVFGIFCVVSNSGILPDCVVFFHCTINLVVTST